MTETAKAKRILVTGSTGCVGQYLVEDLLAETPHELVLVVRNPAKLPAAVGASPRVTMIEADVGDVDAYLGRIGHIDTALLVHACWGGPEAYRINVDVNVAIADHLARNGGSRVFYFATGSVIDADLKMLPAAHELGSDYIRSKYRLVEEIEKLGDRIEIVGLYPTLVLGGGDGKPMSHFANLIREVRPWAWLLRFFRAFGKFHYVHGKDIARTTRHLVDMPAGSFAQQKRIVLGNPAITVNEFVAEFSRHLGYRMPFGIELRTGLAEWIIRIFRIQMAPWDRYCMEHRDLSYKRVVSPADYGLPVHCPDVATALDGIGLKAR
jgi:nucleoside-diphosphate-sugar epimerase